MSCAFVFRSLSAIEQFKRGACMLWALTKQHSMALKPLFTKCNEPLNFKCFRRLYTIDWSPEGSNRREEEENSIYCWDVCLHKCEGKQL